MALSDWDFDVIGMGSSFTKHQERRAESLRKYGMDDHANALLENPIYKSYKDSPQVKAQTQSKTNIASWLDNALTGNRDFQRQVALQQMQQEFNSAEAAKAFQRQLKIAQNSTKWQAEQLHQLGVNPAWAIAGGGASSPSIATAPTATSQAGSASSSGSQFGAAMSTLGQLVITAAKLAILIA